MSSIESAETGLGVSSGTAGGRAAKARPWDFRNPDKLSKEHLRSIAALHQSFARLAATALSSRLRSLVTVKLSSVEQALYGEYISLLPERCLLSTVSLAPLPGRILLDLAPEIALTMAERLLGGDGRNVDLERELTDIDLALVRSVLRLLIEAVGEAWAAMVKVEARLEEVVTGPQLVHAAPSDSVVIVLLEVAIGARSGALSLCLPHRVLEPVVPRLSPQLWSTSGRSTAGTETRPQLESLLRGASVRVSAVAGEIEVSVGELATLRPGDVLLFGSGRELSLGVKVSDYYRFRGRPGLVGGRVAVKIERIEDPLGGADGSTD